MKSHLDEDMKDHLDLLSKKFSSIKVAYEKECSKSEELTDELEEAKEELTDVKDKLEATKEELEEAKEELEEVKQELEDERTQQREKTVDSEDLTLVKKLCVQRQESGFCRAIDQILVANLPLQVTEQMLKSIFGQHGPIHAVKLFPDFDIAVVEFRFSDSISKMFQKYHSSGIRLRGYQLKCVHLKY